MNDAYPFDKKIDYEKLEFLIGTSANSVEFWPGPNDIRNWDWIKYAKYVSTSLDSFNFSISQLALQHYPPNFKLNNNLMNKKAFEINRKQSSQLNEINQLNSQIYLDKKRQKSSPESLYTRMVSDIKQLCPINKVSENLVKYHNSTVFRYVAASEPSYPVCLILKIKKIFNFQILILI